MHHIFVRNGYMWSLDDFNERSSQHIESVRLADFVILVKSNSTFRLIKNREDGRTNIYAYDFDSIKRYMQKFYDKSVSYDSLGCAYGTKITVAEVIEDRSYDLHSSYDVHNMVQSELRVI